MSESHEAAIQFFEAHNGELADWMGRDLHLHLSSLIDREVARRTSISGPFRAPRVIEMARNGDRRRFLCLMEIKLGKIYAGAFTVTALEDETLDSLAWAYGLERAFRQIRVRAERDLPVPAGSSWDEINRDIE